MGITRLLGSARRRGKAAAGRARREGAGAGRFSGAAVVGVCWSADNGQRQASRPARSSIMRPRCPVHLPSVTEQRASVCIASTRPSFVPGTLRLTRNTTIWYRTQQLTIIAPQSFVSNNPFVARFEFT